MSNTTFTSAGQIYNMTINPAIPTTNGKKYPVIFLIHGNAGLVAPFGAQIHGFAKDLAGLGYLTLVPEYYNTNYPPNLGDRIPHNQTLVDAISAISTRPDVDLDRLGLIGFSLGAATAMTFIASKPKGTVKVLADFFGFLAPEIKREEVAKFPPTIILHNGDDKIVDISYSNELNTLLEHANIKHQFEVYDEDWRVNYHGLLVEVDHSFKPGGIADIDSRRQATDWFVNHLPPIGI